jgi:hypothetical protein
MSPAAPPIEASAADGEEVYVVLQPENLYLNPGSAVIIEGLQQAPQYNGQRALCVREDAGVLSINVERHACLVQGREKPMWLRPACFRVEGLAVVGRREATLPTVRVGVLEHT